ncbi:MAG: hypothetical protein KGZ75_12645 [Syntrophomonadaceae bacterium]|nr:hypothetical protein [Syntrophomonadaceae bacterium]
MDAGELNLVLAFLALGTVLWIWAGGLIEAFQPRDYGRIVLRVKNCGASIEGLARNLLPRLQAEGWLISVVDAGSDDDTPQILHRLKKILPGLEEHIPGDMQAEPFVEVNLSYLKDSREGYRLVRQELAK